jgi:phytoene dehydrogenase-like protein
VVPLDRLSTAGVAKLFLASAHARGWPVVRGGSERLAEALVSHLESLGGEVRTGWKVGSLDELPVASALLFDTDVRQLSAIAGERLSPTYLRALKRFRHGPGTFKVDFLVEEGVPWAAEGVADAGTVHVGGSFEECARAEAAVGRGEHPAEPFVLVAQQGALDPSRAPVGHEMVWAYCHVPPGSDRDMTVAIESQIERFAPGFRDRIIDRWTTEPAAFESANPNLVGGDITGGANHLGQLVRRPRALRPYRTSDNELFLCSASTPPGGGVHGMAGHLAAKAALRGALA